MNKLNKQITYEASCGPDTVISAEIWGCVWQTRNLFFASSHCNSNRRTMGNKFKIFQMMVNSVKEVNKVM